MINWIEVEEERAHGDIFERSGFETNVMHAGIAVEGAGVVGRYFTLEPGTITTAQAVKKWIECL
ncbi:hypothetical protein D3C76_1743810 [compost metagenome]